MIRLSHHLLTHFQPSRHLTVLLALSATLLSPSLFAGVIAIIDSGVNSTGNLVGHVRSDGYDFIDLDNDPQDLLGHGTAVASTAVTRYSGVSILPIRIFAYGDGNTSIESQGIRFAANHPDVGVINLSLAGEGNSEEEFAALQMAVGADKVIVMAAGNSGGSRPLSPARLAGTLKGSGVAVGSVDGNNRIQPYSNRAGDLKDFFLVAPDGGGGTSFAAPVVAAAASRIIDRDPHLTSSQAVEILLTTAYDLGQAGTDLIYGRGLVDVVAALNTPVNGLTVSTGGGAGIAIAAGAAAVGYALYGSLKGQVEETLALDGYGRSFMIDLGKSLYPTDDIGMRSFLGHSQNRLQQAVVFELDQSRQQRRYASTETSGDWDRRTVTLRGTDGHFDYRLDLSHQFKLMGGVPPLSWGDQLVGPFSVAPLTTIPSLTLTGRSDALSLTHNLSDRASLSISFAQNEEGRWSSSEESLSTLSGYWSIGEGFDMGFVTGRALASDRLLGGNSSSLFSAGRADSRAHALLARWALTPRLTLIGEGALETTNVRGDHPGMLQEISTIEGQAWGLGLLGRQLMGPRDTWGLALLAPFRITRGEATLVTPRHRNPDGSIGVENKLISLQPAGRERILEMFYHSSLLNNSFWEGRLQFREQPWHLAEARSQATFMATIGLNF